MKVTEEEKWKEMGMLSYTYFVYYQLNNGKITHI